MDRNPITLTRSIISSQRQHQQAAGDFTVLLTSIQLACKVISSSVRRAGIANLYGLAGMTNVQGEEVKKLDVLANETFINSLTFSEKIGIMASEELEEPILIPDARSGKYAVVFDPLDGSTNIDVNVSVGSIFGIYRRKSEHEPSAEKDLLNPGREMVAAGYAVYGSSTMIVLTTGNGVQGFMLDPAIGEFVLTHPNIRIPDQGKIYSINEGNANRWHETTRRYIQSLKRPSDNGSAYSLRYIGSMVADVHRTLLYGGIFMYPADEKSPQGKLRLLYEGAPMAMIMEQAGGTATTGRERILDVVPTSIHDRVPVAMGSTRDVMAYESMVQSTE